MQIATYLNYKKIHIIDCHLIMQNRCQTQEKAAVLVFIYGQCGEIFFRKKWVFCGGFDMVYKIIVCSQWFRYPKIKVTIAVTNDTVQAS